MYAAGCFCGQYTFVVSPLSEAKIVFHCRERVSRWYAPAEGGEVASAAPARMDQAKTAA